MYFGHHLKIIFTSINKWSWCSTAHFTIDTPSTSIVSLQTLAAAIDDNRCNDYEINGLIVTTFMWEASVHMHNFTLLSCYNICMYVALQIYIQVMHVCVHTRAEPIIILLLCQHNFGNNRP